MPMYYDYDIFISYAQPEENETSTDWTLKFCDFLSLILQRLYNKKPTILLHDDLRTRKNLLGENPQYIFSKTAIFVIFLSPEYIRSKEYMSELEEIYNAVVESNAQLQIKRHRILKIVTMPIPSDEQPVFLKNELSYNFFEINRYNKKPVTYNLNGKDGPDQKFWSKIVDLAYDISNIMAYLDSLKDESGSTEPKRTIFLAETTFDQVDNRDMLKRELQHMGYNVLPLVSIPEDSENAKHAIEDCLGQSMISIHLLGGWYGDFLKNSKYSLIDFQIKTVKDYVSDRNNKSKPDQVIWIPSDLKATDQRQVLYLKRLKRDESQYKTEIIESPFEVFKTALNVKLNELIHPSLITIAEKNKLYIIYERISSEKIGEYLNIIRAKGYDFIESRSENDEFYSLSEHLNNLLIADAVLIYKGNSTMDWLNSKIRDLVKIPGYGKSKPFRAVEIISPEKTADKSLLFLKNVPVNWDEEINENVINHFLGELEKK
ncbi:MAG: hypothetical protein JXA61_09310 [Bacteroidales bacterium]|nr:hypothetical protein [Bacteroidales bacterium]